MSHVAIGPRKAPWGAAVLAFLAVGIAGYGIVSYLTGHPLEAGFLQGKAHYQGFAPTTTWTFALIAHVAGGCLALLAGAAQWLTVRLAYRPLHVLTGVLYAVGIAVGGGAGLVLAPAAMGGWVSAVGFGALDVLWLTSTARAVQLGFRLRKTEDKAAVFRLHRAWMTRSFALTAAAITLRLWLPLSALAGLDFVASYTVIAWLCWVPNLIAAEVLIRGH